MHSSILPTAGLLILSSAGAIAGTLDDAAKRFAESDFVFNRARSDIPFIPFAWASATFYDESRFLLPSGEPGELTFEQQSVSEATFLPFLIGRRDAVVIGQWMNWTRFDLSNGSDKEVFSVAIPVGWARQTSPDWQVAAFVAPLGHSSEGDGWYWEYMGGVFARWLQTDRFAWLFGFFADVAPREEFYTPYVGLTWTVNQHWTVSAIMPWPAILYAPNTDWLFRFGVSPSDASWSVEIDDDGSPRKAQLSFGAWNLGISAERRIWKFLWLGAEVGVAGFRGFTFSGSDWEGPNSDLGTDAYATIRVNFRPGSWQ
ncbi:hypothetical protein HNQ60_004068 [Povalibacter uvarum]|uniref:Transporter n=1 Tax=Povalibacter uvarum TaxID=732238 RepID=A0A841HT35_9GAMM|nr:hypothetical protein [Povalibacter uvarum]MBB6095178.1 hypothetical protein [Povalibacter uvarum]